MMDIYWNQRISGGTGTLKSDFCLRTPLIKLYHDLVLGTRFATTLVLRIRITLQKV